MIVAPSALATSSTAVIAVVFSRSRIGFTSTTSSEPASTGLGDELECQVRFAVRETSANGCPHARCDLGIEHVHVERDVHEPGPGDPVQ